VFSKKAQYVYCRCLYRAILIIYLEDRALFLPLPPLKEVMEGWALSPEPVTLSDFYM
jgi:hypothetical protein